MFRDDEDNVFVSGHEQVYGRSREEVKRRELQKRAAEKRVDKVKVVNSLRRQLFQLKMQIDSMSDEETKRQHESQEEKKTLDSSTKTHMQEEQASVENAQTQATASRMIDKEKKQAEAKQASQQEYSSDAA